MSQFGRSFFYKKKRIKGENKKYKNNCFCLKNPKENT